MPVPTRCTSAALFVIFGFLTNRLNISLTGMEAASGTHYIPKWTEIMVTLSVVALGLRHLPVRGQVSAGIRGTSRGGDRSEREHEQARVRHDTLNPAGGFAMDSASRSFRIGIAAKLAVYLVLGTGAVFLLFAVWNIRVHRAHAEALVKQHAAGIDEVIQRSTRYHMLRNDREALQQIIADIGSEPGIRRIRIYNRKGEISFSDSNKELGSRTTRPGRAATSKRVDRAVVRIVKDIHGRAFRRLGPPHLEPAGLFERRLPRTPALRSACSAPSTPTCPSPRWTARSPRSRRQLWRFTLRRSVADRPVQHRLRLSCAAQKDSYA